MLHTSLGYIPAQQNLIINGDFQVAQRGASFTAATTPANSDDTYLLDRWILLSDGNDIVDVSQVAVPFSRSGYGLKAEVETANKKFGFIQVIESSTCIPLRGKRISLSFAAKTYTAKEIENIRCAVLEWTGTADTVTSDVVSAWGAEGADPTFAASWAALNTPANLALATTETTYKIENLTVGASCNNLAVFIWVDDTDAAVDDLLYLGEVQMVRGTVATPFVSNTVGYELLQCQRYYFGNYTVAVSLLYAASSGQGAIVPITYPTTMRAVPSITLINTLAGNCAAEGSVSSSTTSGVAISHVSSAAGPVYFTDSLKADAEL